MPAAETLSDPTEAPTRRRRRLWPSRWRWRVSLIALIALILFAAAIWIGRERIAGNLIDDALEANGLEATYEIVSIGPEQQVISNLVIGDPDMPDLIAETVIVRIKYVFGTPEIGGVQLINPRLYGTFRDGQLSFGALDPLIFAESEEPSGLPALDIAIRDGRARIDSDYGAIGIKVDGAGRLDGGFEGILAATAPGVGTDDCRADEATLYGEISVAGGEPSFDGPLRVRGLDCSGARVETADVAARLTLSEDLASVAGELGMDMARLAYGENLMAGLTGGIDLDWRFAGDDGEPGDLGLRHDLFGSGLATPYGRVGEVRAEGTVRLAGGFSRGEWSSDITGDGIDVDLGSSSALAEARRASEGTLAAALLGKLERGLATALRDGRLSGELTLRTNEDGMRVVVPEARLRSGAGETVLALSRVSYAKSARGRADRLTGNILTGGPDLPQINGRMERVGGGDVALRMTMAEYRAGSNALAIPRMQLRQSASGRITFDGLVRAEGALPGEGAVRGLQLPVQGSWSAREGLAIGETCTTVRFSSLRLYQLGLDARSLRLCPGERGAMVRYGEALRLAVATSDLDLAGQLADTPMRISAARMVMRYPGSFRIDGLEAMVGPSGNAVNLTATGLEGSFADEIGGRFEGGTAGLDAVPLDLADLSGEWTYVGSILSISDGAFELTERTGAGLAPEARFEPMQARGATLKLEDNVITAAAALRRFAGGQVVANVDVRHDLTTSRGRADIDVPGVSFDEGFQPTDLTYLADGVVQLVRGTVTGEGAITWTGSDVESTGTFRTDSLDLAAAFGPVQGISGEIEFTDLLGLTTAPGQVLEIASVNPGIEALGGRVTYALSGGTVVGVEEGRWPFMGGELILRPVTLDFGSDGGASYVFEIVGLDAAAFVAQMEIDNIGARGIFDGTIPIAFDSEGNGLISGGLLISRPPGGNVAYVGELTYEDMGAIANFAFNSLRSLDFDQMSVELDGSVSGEIITRFVIDGVTQGEGADSNFITRRIAALPIRFNINVRSENFSQLALVARGINDPTAFGDAVDQGIFIFEDGQLIRRPDPTTPLDEDPERLPDTDEAPDAALPRDESDVQPPESDEMP
ncbi:MAG: intermembrane phospholipid transport protein YdbH family protein [Erythrobacter sp.]